MKTMAISEFKAHALRVLAEVAESRESIVITRRGKPLVRVVPHCPSETKLTPGRLSGTFVFEDDIVSPLGAALWEAC